MSSYCLDVENFISEVKKYPEIWDSNSEDNRYKAKKQRAWTEIARVFIPEFDDIPAVEKIDVCKYHTDFTKVRNAPVKLHQTEPSLVYFTKEYFTHSKTYSHCNFV